MITTFIVVTATILTLYLIVWAFIIRGYNQEREHIYNTFLRSWDENSYVTEPYTDWSNGSVQLMVEFTDEHDRRYGFSINPLGELERDFHQRSSPVSVKKVKSKQLKQRFKTYTEQIITMAKIEGKIDNDLADQIEHIGQVF